MIEIGWLSMGCSNRFDQTCRSKQPRDRDRSTAEWDVTIRQTWMLWTVSVRYDMWDEICEIWNMGYGIWNSHGQ
jgi:hypothetical protein